jgi:hypothetical protein
MHSEGKGNGSVVIHLDSDNTSLCATARAHEPRFGSPRDNYFRDEEFEDIT